MFSRRPSPTARRMLGASLACAVGAAVLANGFVGRVAQRDPGPLVPVVVAANDLAPGHVLTSADLRRSSLPQRWAIPSHAQDPMQLTNAVTLGPVAAGEPISLARVGRGGELAALVPEGLRAIVVPSTLPHGTVRIGDRVDVLSTATQGAIYTDTIAENVEVLRILSTGAPGATGTPNVTEFVALLVDPITAEGIAQAMHTTVVTLVVEPQAVPLA